MKVKYSALVSDMRNKLNGSVASKNRYGSYLRNKVTPVNPQSIYQQQMRQLLGNVSSAFRGLTSAQIASWNAQNVQFPFTDIFGDIRHLSGQALFVKLNVNLEKIGQPRIAVPPAPSAIPALATTGTTATVQAGALDALDASFDVASTPPGFSLVAYATPPLNHAVSFVKPQYRFLGVFPITTNDADLLSEYTARFGSSAVAGQRIHMRFALVDNATGQQGIPVATFATVT